MNKHFQHGGFLPQIIDQSIIRYVQKMEWQEPIFLYIGFQSFDSEGSVAK